MNFIELAKKRFSARGYLNRAVEKVKIEYLLEAARIAPSAVNKQPLIVYVVENELIKKEIHKTYAREWFKQAPVIFVVCTDKKQSWKHPQNYKDHADIDAAIAIDHITLAAADVDLATCWVCNFDVEKLKIALQISDPSIEPVALLPIGYSDVEADTGRHETNRKDLSQFVIRKD